MPPAFHPSDPVAAMWPVMLVLAAAILGGLVYLQRSGIRRDGIEITVRCRAGHVFRTSWPSFVAAKAARMGGWRLQYCPIGRHWTFVRPTDPRDLDRLDG